MHGHGGMTLEALKFYALNHDVGSGDVYYVGANTSWMVWNTLAYNLMCGASVVTYAGSTTFGRADRQFDIIARTGTTTFATARPTEHSRCRPTQPRPGPAAAVDDRCWRHSCRTATDPQTCITKWKGSECTSA